MKGVSIVTEEKKEFNILRFFLILLVVVGFLVYFNSLFGAFVWDDENQILNNYLIHSLSNTPKFFLGGTFSPENSANLTGLYYKPLLTLFFATIYALSGPHSFLFHLVQVSLHIGNSILVFLFFKRFLKETTSFLIALLFLIHPISVEAVSYISALQEPLFLFFGMCALLLYNKTMTRKRVVTVGILLLCSLLSKETGIVFVAMVLLMFLLFDYQKKFLVARLFMTGIPLIIYLWLRFFVAKIYFHKLPDVPMMTSSFLERVYSMPAIFLYYIQTFFFPKDLLILQRWAIPGPTNNFFIMLFLDAIIILCLALGGLYVVKKQKSLFKYYLFFFCWFLLGMLIHLQILPLDMTVAERWFYFPIIGLLGMIGIVLQSSRAIWEKWRFASISLVVIIITLLSIRTVIRNTNWQNGVNLFRHDLVAKKEDDRLENLLAIELSQTGKYDEAEKHFEHLLKRNPSEQALYINLAVIAETKGDISRTKQLYTEILPTDTTGVAAYNLSRIALQQEGDAKEAQNIAREALTKYPNNANLWLILAVSSENLNDINEALQASQKALDLMPNQTTQEVYNRIVNKK